MNRFLSSCARLPRVVISVGVAVLLGSLAVPTAAAPVSITTPAGLNPGDRFRIAFLTGTTASPDASSTDIAYYNLFVNTAAGGATYNGSAITFYAIGSTSTVNAYDNIRSTTMNDPVYLVSGTLVAPSITGTTGLWSGALVNRITTDIDGTVISPNGGQDRTAFTGTLVNGTATSRPFGNYNAGFPPFFPPQLDVSTGQATGYTNAAWIDNQGGGGSGLQASLYGISDTLTVAAVPEPSTCASLLAGLACGGYSLFRHRRAR